MKKTRSLYFILIKIMVVLLPLFVSMFAACWALSAAFDSQLHWILMDISINQLLAGMFVVVAITTVWLTLSLDGIVRRALRCNYDEYNKTIYPEGYIILPISVSAETEVCRLRANGEIPKHRGYTVLIGLSYHEIDTALDSLESSKRNFCWHIPRAQVMPDGISCFCGRKVALRTLQQIHRALRPDGVAYLVYFCGKLKVDGLPQNNEENSIVITTS